MGSHKLTSWGSWGRLKGFNQEKKKEQIDAAHGPQWAHEPPGWPPWTPWAGRAVPTALDQRNEANGDGEQTPLNGMSL